MRELALALAFTAVACTAQRALEADRAYEAGLAQVERLDVDVHRMAPVSVLVTVSGWLPDACTELDRVRQERRLSGIDVELSTRRASGAACPAQPQAFQRTLTLDIQGLPRGVYFVSVNGVQATFEIPTGAVVPLPLER